MADELKVLMEAAHVADEAFSQACVRAGFKSRWDWNQHTTPGPEFLREAYRAKVTADNAVHVAFNRNRAEYKL